MLSENQNRNVEENSKRRWLSIIGLGAEGVAGLGAAACKLIEEAELVVGGARHLALTSHLTKGQTLAWPSPIEKGIAALLEWRGKSVVVLASGDPFHFGVGSLLSRHVAVDEFQSLPAPSSISLAASRLGWALQDVAVVSVHGRPLENVIRHLSDGVRILALSWDGTTPGKLADLLTARGFGGSRLHVLENIGGEGEGIRSALAEQFTLENIEALNIVALDIKAGVEARPVPLTCGLDDDFFENDGQLTKREIRAITLSALAPRAGELLWDIGLGAGSIAIEWLLAHPSCRAVGIERDANRAARARRNALSMGVPHLDIVQGDAPSALQGLPVPDAIFIGGGATADGVFDMAWSRLRPGGRLVVNAVTLETETLLLAWQALHGGTLTRIMISRAEPVGTMQGWQSAMPVTQWKVSKP